jgi:hypothetical protein
MTKLKQPETMEDFISSFEHLDFQMEGMTYDFLRECFISGLKDEIHAQVIMSFPQTWLEATKHAKGAQYVIWHRETNPLLFPSLNPTPLPLKPLLSRSKS